MLTISSHVRIHSHITEKVQLLVYDPSWSQPMDIGIISPDSSIAIPLLYSMGSEIRLRCLGDDWNFSSPIPLNMSSSYLSVSCTHPSKTAYFCVSFEKGHVHLYDPLKIENMCPVPIYFTAREGEYGEPQEDQVDVGCSTGIWWCMNSPLFKLQVPGCKRTSWLQLKRENSKQYSIVLRRIDDRPMTILVSVRENAAKAATISLYTDIWLINRTGCDLSFGNDIDDDNYHPEKDALCVLDDASMCMYSSSTKSLRIRLQSNWSENIKLDPRRMSWQDECLSVFEGRRLYEFGISADYATRHFGVLTTIVTITPRYLFVNRSPWTIILLEEESQGSLPPGMGHVDHIIPSGESYSLYWMGNSRQRLRASVIDYPGQSSWSEPFGINEQQSLELLIPNDENCPRLQVVVKQGGLSQSTFVIDISNAEMDQLQETQGQILSWGVIVVNIQLAEMTMTLLDTSKEVDLFTGPVLDEVARFSVSRIQYNMYKDKSETQSNLYIKSMALHDLLPRSKYPIVLASSARSSKDFVVLTYNSKHSPKYHLIEKLQVEVQNVQLQTSMTFVNRINGMLSETLSHFESERSIDLLAYFTSINDLSTLTGRKWFFKSFTILPIHVNVSFVRDKDTSNSASSNFWLSHLKLKIKDASLVLDGFKLTNALATKESVAEALTRFYTASVKGQALGLIESIQVLPLVTGVVTEGVSSLVSTILGKADTTLASSNFRQESLSNSGIVMKHSKGVKGCTSTAQLHTVLNHLVFDWDGNHTGLEARACMAAALINNSSQSIVVQASLRDGAELRLLPDGRQYMAPGGSDWRSDRCLILFAWGYTPTLLTTGDVAINVQSNAFTLTLSKSFKRLQANRGYTATFTLQESQSWWSKYMIVVSDELQTITTTDDQDTYEVLFTESTLGIIAKQQDYQTVVVRECCRFSNGQPSPALACGMIAEGDHIISVNGLPVRTTAGFKSAIVNTARPIVVRFSRKRVAAVEDEDYNLFG